MRTCSKIIEFDYGHRLMNHESKCAHCHGHRGKIEIKCASESLDKAGRVIDFGLIKQIVGGWVDERWDHAFLVNQDDAPMVNFLREQNQRRFDFPGEPSAENIAEYIYRQADALLRPRNVEVVLARFWETPTSIAEYP